MLPALVVCLASAAAVRGQTFAWKSVNIQGMGYVTGLVIHPLAPFDIYIRTDVGGAYRFDRSAGRWLPLLDQFGRDHSESYGVESVAVDPNDANTIYLATPYGQRIVNVTVPGDVLVSHNRGATWASTGLNAAGIYMGPNDAARGTTGERLMADPNDTSVLYFASRQDGLWRRDPAGTWAKVAGGLPASGAQPGFTFVVFGPEKAVYTGVYGSGVWASNDGGATWRNILATPNNTCRAAVTTDGALFVTFGGDEGATSGSVWRFSNGAWTDVTPLGAYDAYAGVTADPVDAGTLVTAANGNRKVYRSTDHGATWTPVPAGTIQNAPGYYQHTPPGLSIDDAAWGDAALAIDPVNRQRLWQTNGYGVVAIDNAASASPAWQWTMDNLEELVVQKVKVPPVPGGADLLSMAADMVGFRHASRDVPPETTIVKFNYVAQGTSLAYSTRQPRYVAFAGWDETLPLTDPAASLTGFSSDNGVTWTPFPNTTPGAGGRIAMSATDPLNMVWSPARSATPQYTTDGGRTWNQCRYGAGTLSGSWQMSNEWWPGDILISDGVNGGTFYYYDNGSVYFSTDEGATWQLGNTTWPMYTLYTVAVSMAANPVKAGDLWLTLANNANQPTGFPLFHSTDSGRTFIAAPGIDAANYMAFGKGSSADTPAMYLHGRATGAIGDAIYQSLDGGSTWTAVSDPRLQQFGEITSLEGDMRTRDLVYVGLGGRGIVYGRHLSERRIEPALAPRGLPRR